MTTWGKFLLDFVGDARLSKLLSSFLPGLLATGALFLIALTLEPDLWKGVDAPEPAANLVDSPETEKAGEESKKLEKPPAQKRELEARIQTTKQKLKLEGDWLSALNTGGGAGLRSFIETQPFEKDKLNNLMIELNRLRNESYTKLLGFSQELHRDTERLAEVEKLIVTAPDVRKPLLSLFYDYLIQFILPGLILGVFIGQLARVLLVKGFFKDKTKTQPVSVDTLLAEGFMTQENYTNLVSRTYDYSAICASNAIGLTIFGIVWVYFGVHSDYSLGRVILPAIMCFGMASVLIYAGQKSYARFIKGKKEWQKAEGKSLSSMIQPD